MSTEGGPEPMEEEEVPLCDSPSTDSTTMDWVKVDERTETDESSPALPQSHHPVGANAVTQSENLPVQNPPDNCDEYSFGSSDDDAGDDEEENGLEKLAYVSLDTAFDMGILQSSIEGSKDALNLVVGKEVVMVVGKTGVGKSTLIQGIAGKRIHTSFHKASFSGETATKTVFDAQDALPNFEIGHAKASKTRSLNAFLRKCGDNEVLFLDSPGLEDTRGAEMDIATSALLSQVAKRCKSLRFVILIHCASLLEERGNTFRSVLQFANLFVQDFSESKMSFMFMFTHTDEITGMSNSSGDAKKRLQEEIIQIASATKDEDVLAVLDFVRRSLKKNYPFADILHPLDTNFPKLADAIEQLQGVRDLTSASSCNLTLSSRFKLEVAVQHLLERLQAALRSSSPNNTTKVKDILRSFHYLSEYVDVESVRKAARQSEEIINDHKKDLNRCIELEFTRWTSSSSAFEKGNARALQDALLLLQDFDSTFSAERWIQSKNEDVTKLQDEILMKASSCKQFRREFGKLQTWADVFCRADVFKELCTKLMTLFESTMAIVSRTDPATLHEQPEEEVTLFVESFMVLQTMRDFSEQISVPEINLACATTSHEKLLEDLKCVFRSWTVKAAQLAESKNVNFKDDFKDIASHALVLESMNAVLRKYDIGVNSLDKNIESALRSLESDVIGLFTLCCDDLVKNSSSFDPSWEPKLRWMRDACQRFSKMHSGRWKEMFSSFSAVTNKIKPVLYSSSGELENMSQVTKEHGMRSGGRLGEDLVKFRRCKWFDSYLPQGEAFVANCCVAIELAFQERIEEKSTELARTLTSLPQRKYFSSESIEKLELLLPELKEIDKFLTIVSESAGVKPSPWTQDPEELAALDHESLFEKCASHLEDHTHYLSDQATECTRDWTTNISARKFDCVYSLAQNLDLIYADAKALNNIQSLEVVAQKSHEILYDISNAVQELSRLVKSELKIFRGDFNLKVNILTSIKACSRLSHIGKHLTDYKDVQHQVRNLVASEAQKVEREIEASV